MIISRDDPRFWDVRTVERRLRRGEMTVQEYQTRLEALHDVSEKGTVSVPLDEPDDRAQERRQPSVPIVRVTMPPPSSDDDLDDLDDDDEDDDDEDDDDEDDDDEDDDDEKDE